MNARCWWVGALLVALAGCETYTIDGNYTCADPDKGHRGPDGMPDPCHYQDAGAPVDAGVVCAVGELEHYGLHWASPTLLWFGPEGQAPECPQGPKSMSYEGYADLVAPTARERLLILALIRVGQRPEARQRIERIRRATPGSTLLAELDAAVNAHR